MKHTLLITFLASVFIPSVLAMAQSYEGAQAYESFKPYGDISPSVESFSMTKYGKVSPSLYSGTMSYSIPLYVYSDPDFSIPISLEYNYDGYKPPMSSGSVGLGWALNCGGVITREIKGIPDEGLLGDANTHGWYHTIMDGIDIVDESDVHGAYQPNVKSSTFSLANISSALPTLWTPSCDEFKGVVQSLDACSEIPVCIPEGTSTKYDLAPDIFHFSFCGMNGDFMIVGKKPGHHLHQNVDVSTLSNLQCRICVSETVEGHRFCDSCLLQPLLKWHLDHASLQTFEYLSFTSFTADLDRFITDWNNL